MDYIFKKATYDDIEDCLQLAYFANQLMLKRNNPQWSMGYPTKEILTEDVDKNQLIVVLEENKIVAMMALVKEKDSLYEEYDFWTPGKYISVHRVVSRRSGLGRKLLNLAIDKAKKMGANVRIDTHVKNLHMQSLIESLNFKKVGEVAQPFTDNTLALSYELVLN